MRQKALLITLQRNQETQTSLSWWNFYKVWTPKTKTLNVAYTSPYRNIFLFLTTTPYYHKNNNVLESVVTVETTVIRISIISNRLSFGSWLSCPKGYPTSDLTAKTIMENEDLKKTCSEDEDERDKEDDGASIEEESLVWREACCTALERHSDNAVVQVSHVALFIAVKLFLVFIICNVY